MSPLAQIVRSQGNTVTGSDRSFDTQGLSGNPLVDIFRNQCITLYPQDGSAIKTRPDAVIVSSAIEKDNPDIISAHDNAITIMTRAELLAALSNEKLCIAVGGTSGKSTVTAMIAHILDLCNHNPTYIGGGILKNLSETPSLANFFHGQSPIICIETDESDGSIVLYKPTISVLTNISKDHKDISVLLSLFQEFINNTSQTVIINNDCPYTDTLTVPKEKAITCGIDTCAEYQAHEITSCDTYSQFTVKDTSFRVSLPGRHNIANALTAIAACHTLDIPLTDIASALKQFKGIKRRLELIGETRGIKVYDDFSHNPDKISAALSALRPHCNRVIAVFQPHGFAPTKHLRDDYITLFSNQIRDKDILFITDIYDAGGSATRDIHSSELIEKIKTNQPEKDCQYLPDKKDIMHWVEKNSRSGDTILVMGARDNSLTELCENIVKNISNTK